MPIKADLDEIDWKILRELQNNGRITNVELAERVGISAPPCLRRVRKLEESGVIRGYRAILNGNTLGQDLVAFCSSWAAPSGRCGSQGFRRKDQAMAARSPRMDDFG